MSDLYSKASLVMNPQLVDTGKVYSIKPEDRKGDFTFTRSSAATRVNADGNIEKETQNLLLQSNSFDTTWGSNGTLTSGQSGYDGTNDAWLFTYTSDPSIAFISNTNSGVQTLSLYAKGNVNNGLRMYAFGSSNCQAYFDLNTGSVEITNNIIDAAIEDKGNGWYRCSMTFNQTNSSINFYLSTNANGNATSGSIYIQDAQLEQGMVARDYIETTTAAVEGGITDNVPRLDYTDSSCPALLLEPQRTNLAALSEYFKGWSHKPNTTTTSNYTTSPEGLKNATRLQFTANGYLYNSNAPAQVNGAQHTLSCYAKRNDSGTQSFGFFTNGSGSVDSTMSLTSEWQRFTYTYTATNASQLGLAGLSGADVSVFGFQVEASASYATSYIPTYGTSVTRNADYATKTGVSDLIGQTEGSAYLEIKEFIPQPPGNIGAILSLHGGSSTNRIGIIHLPNTTEIQVYVITGGAAQALYNFTPSSGINKIAIGYANNDIAIAVNGAIAYTDTNATIPATSAIGLNTYGFTNIHANDSIKQVLLFKERLSNAELATLTTI